jgi:hypothetical protein
MQEKSQVTHVRIINNKHMNAVAGRTELPDARRTATVSVIKHLELHETGIFFQ